MPGNTNIPIMPKMFWKPSMRAWPSGSFSWMPTSKTEEGAATYVRGGAHIAHPIPPPGAAPLVGARGDLSAELGEEK